jgi:hypothetical protein
LELGRGEGGRRSIDGSRELKKELRVHPDSYRERFITAGVIECFRYHDELAIEIV